MPLHILAEISGNLHVAAAAIGAGFGVALVGAKACEAVGRNPGAAAAILTQSVLSMAFAEGLIFFAIYLKP